MITAVTVALTVAVVPVISANITLILILCLAMSKTRATTAMSLEAVRDETNVARTFSVNAPFNCKLE